MRDNGSDDRAIIRGGPGGRQSWELFSIGFRKRTILINGVHESNINICFHALLKLTRPPLASKCWQKLQANGAALNQPSSAIIPSTHRVRFLAQSRRLMEPEMQDAIVGQEPTVQEPCCGNGSASQAQAAHACQFGWWHSLTESEIRRTAGFQYDMFSSDSAQADNRAGWPKLGHPTPASAFVSVRAQGNNSCSGAASSRCAM